MKSLVSHKSNNFNDSNEVHAALLDFDGCAAPMIINQELSYIQICLEQIKQFCVLGSQAVIPKKKEDPHYHFKSLARALLNIRLIVSNVLPIRVHRENNTALTIKNKHYSDAMIKFFGYFMGELNEFRNSPILEKQAMLPIVTHFLQVYFAWKKKLNNDTFKSSQQAYQYLADRLKQNISIEGDLDELFTSLYNAIKYFLELFQKFTLGVIICRLFSQGYDPLQHPLIFISASARINNELDNRGNQHNHNGTVLELMQTLPALVKDFLRIHCNVSQDNQKKIEFWRNMPLDMNDSDHFQIEHGEGVLYDQSKIGIVLWATHLLLRYFKQHSLNGESKIAIQDQTKIIAYCLDDLLMQGTTVKGYEKVQYAMQYLAKKSYLLPKGVELSLIGFKPRLFFKNEAILQPFIDAPFVGTGPTVSRDSISHIVNSVFDVLPEKRLLNVRCWLCCCAYASHDTASFWLQNLQKYEVNLRKSHSHLNSNAAPVVKAMHREHSNNSTLPLLPKNNSYHESLNMKMNSRACLQYQCSCGVCACAEYNCYVDSLSKLGCC